jgi:hypothetical protein
MAVFKDGDQITKGIFSNRFQEAIDEAAMRLGETDSDAYLAGWHKSDWIQTSGDLTEISKEVIADIENDFTSEKLAEILNNL